MATNNKDFKVKNNLVVQSGQVTLGDVPLAFDTNTNKLRIYINNQWVDIVDSGDLSFMDVGLAIDYNGQPIYAISSGGTISDATKYADGGGPSTTSFAMTFDSGVIS